MALILAVIESPKKEITAKVHGNNFLDCLNKLTQLESTISILSVEKIRIEVFHLESKMILFKMKLLRV